MAADSAGHGRAAEEARAYASVAEAAQAQDAGAALDMVSQGFAVDDQDGDGNTALHWAAWFRLHALTTRLVELGARPDAGNACGETPVHLAAKASNLAALEAMTGGDYALLSPRDCDGMTPFLISALCDAAPVAEWLYLRGVSVEEQDDLGRTALLWACYRGHARTVQWLLSRSASISHRDHEGMTAIHWAALKGRAQIAEMLFDVGAVHLLSAPNGAGETPIALAMRKQQGYMIMCFHKCLLFQYIFGRPKLSQSHFANLFVSCIAFNACVFLFVLAPPLASRHLGAVLLWAALCAASAALWARTSRADPGWLAPATLLPQGCPPGDDPLAAFDAEQPVESQLAQHCDTAARQALASSGAPGSGGDGLGPMRCGNLVRMEFEQNTYNYQRQLLTEARKRLAASSSFGVGGGGGGGLHEGGPELQPLMGGGGGGGGSSAAAAAAALFGGPLWGASAPPASASAAGPSGGGGGAARQARRAQLERTSSMFRAKEWRMGKSIGRARVEELLSQGGSEYLSLLNRGEFKQVCVVCRTVRRMRSHHCKECGRCVDRLDHHCPWIDNCVGLGNQRSFFCFIVALFLTVLGFYYLTVLYLMDAVFPRILQGLLRGFFATLWSRGLFPALPPVLALGSCAANAAWLLFVGALVTRHTAYVAVNVTTFEVLVRPPHIQRRFPKARRQFWFLKGFRLLDAVRRCADFWALNTDGEEEDFDGGAGGSANAEAGAETSRDSTASLPLPPPPPPPRQPCSFTGEDLDDYGQAAAAVADAGDGGGEEEARLRAKEGDLGFPGRPRPWPIRAPWRQ